MTIRTVSNPISKLLPPGYLRQDIAEGKYYLWTGNDWKETSMEDIQRDTLRITVEVIEYERLHSNDWETT